MLMLQPVRDQKNGFGIFGSALWKWRVSIPGRSKRGETVEFRRVNGPSKVLLLMLL